MPPQLLVGPSSLIIVVLFGELLHTDTKRNEAISISMDLDCCLLCHLVIACGHLLDSCDGFCVVEMRGRVDVCLLRWKEYAKQQVSEW